MSVRIHESGSGADKLTVDSEFNGLAYAVQFGEADTPMRTLFLQGDDASEFRARFDDMEDMHPEDPSREIWLRVLDPYL